VPESPSPTTGDRSGQTVLVTGAAGFIGSHLAEHLLHQGARVVGVDNLNHFYDPAVKRRNLAVLQAHPGFEAVTLDIRQREAMRELAEARRPDAIVHLAAMAGVRPSIDDPSLYAEVNVQGTVNVLDAARAAATRTVAVASSSSVYGNNDKIPFAETDPVDHPISPYAATKKACELIAHTYAHLFGLAIPCLRFFTVYGPRQRPDLAISKFLRRIRDDQPIPVFGDGSTSRDYTYIDDIVAGVLAAMDRAEGYRVYNLGGSQPISLAEMIETIEAVVGKPARRDVQPMQPGDVQRTYADLSRSQAELNYQPTTSFREGVQRQWGWMQKLVERSPTA